MADNERRCVLADLKARSLENDNDMIVEGYATTFNQSYRTGGGAGYEIREEVSDKAFTDTDMSDVVFLYDHEGRVLARISNNTLTLRIDDKGLYVSAKLAGTEDGRSLYSDIKGGYINKMSMCFSVRKYTTSETITDGAAGGTVYTDRIESIGRLYDVSAVSIPANDMTAIEARGRERAEARAKEKEAQAAKEKEVRERQAELIRLGL